MTSSSNLVPMVLNSSKSPVIKTITLMLIEEDLKLIVKQIIDFESFRVNGLPLKSYFEAQGWKDYFEMLNGPTFPYLVKKIWVRAEVYDESDVALEETQKIVENEELKGKSRVEMGLEEFKEVEIRSTLWGLI